MVYGTRGYLQGVPQIILKFGACMSYSINRVTLIGHVGNDPKISEGSTGKQMATFSLATNEKWKDAEGTPHQATEWHNIFIIAEHCAIFVSDYIGKGDHVCVEGQLQTKQYNDREGNSQKRTSIIVKPHGGSIGLLRSNDNEQRKANDDYEDLNDTDYDVPF